MGFTERLSVQFSDLRPVENSHLGFEYTLLESLAVNTSSASEVNSLTPHTTGVHIYTNTHGLTKTLTAALSLSLSLAHTHTHMCTH